MNAYELNPTNSQKSFYGKAIVGIDSTGTKILYSYGTKVCSIDNNGTFHRHWGGYSATTMKHINSFIDTYGINGGGKAWWISQEVTR